MKNNLTVDITFKTVMICSLILGVFTNVFILGLLLYLGLSYVIWSPIIGSGIFITSYFLLNKDKLSSQQVFFITAYTVTTEIFIHTHYIGWDSGFYNYIFLLPAVFLIYGKWKKTTNFLFNASIVLLFLVLASLYINQKGPLSLSSEIESYINLSNFLVTGIVIIVIIFYFRKMVVKKESDLLIANSTLSQQNLKASIQHQNLQVLMKEIHHRVKNNLQMVNSLLRLQANGIEDETVAELFKDARQRILSMAMLHEKMYGSDDLQHIDIHAHFKALIEGLLNSYALDKKIELDLHIEKIDLEIDTLIPLGLMINEIITNSLKYAFKSQDSGKITLHIKQHSVSSYEMIIGDDGIGVQLDALPTGLGSKLIKVFVKQLNGSLKQLDGPGTLIKVIFEKRPAPKNEPLKSFKFLN